MAKVTWKFFDPKTSAWKIVRKNKSKTGVEKHLKDGNAIAIFHLAEGKETGSFFCPPKLKGFDNIALLPKGQPSKFSIRSVS